MSKPKLPVSAQRITAYVVERFGGSTRTAAKALGVDHVTLWRAQRGYAANGPSATLCDALEEHSGKPSRYWRGRDA